MGDELVVDPEYMTRQNDINERMRSILVDWLVSVHWSFQFSPETLCLAVRIIDCYLTSVKESRGQLQLVGAAALLVASEKVEIFPSNAAELVYLCDGAYTVEQVRNRVLVERETLCLRLLTQSFPLV
jgi:cyclin B